MSCAPSDRARSCAICGPNGRDGRRFPASECEMTKCCHRNEPYIGPRVFCRGCKRHFSTECLQLQHSSTMAAVSSMAGFSLRNGPAWAAICAFIDRSTPSTAGFAPADDGGGILDSCPGCDGQEIPETAPAPLGVLPVLSRPGVGGESGDCGKGSAGTEAGKAAALATGEENAETFAAAHPRCLGMRCDVYNVQKLDDNLVESTERIR